MCFPILHHIFQDFFQDLLTWQVMGLGYSTLGRRDVLVHFDVFYSFFFFFFLFRAAPTAYRDSQARGQIGTTAAGLHYSHSNIRF